MRVAIKLDYYANEGGDNASLEFEMEIPEENKEDFQKLLKCMEGDFEELEMEEVSKDGDEPSIG